MYSSFLKVLTVCLLLSCEADQELDQIALLTNGSSKTWVVYEHNFATDNSVFRTDEPSYFFGCYINSTLTLKDILRWESPCSRGQWSILGDHLYFEDLDFVNAEEPDTFDIISLSVKNLTIRGKAKEGSTLPYYEFRFRHKD